MTADGLTSSVHTPVDAAAATAVRPAHRPIGEVLSLLQEEFPDVTISKIRFLESQGLIQPERTASGYRRFSASDVDRLEWILRQQRDHFLPLKVIRKMLDEGVDRYDPGGGSQPTLFTAAIDASVGEDDEPDVSDEDAGPDPDAGTGTPPRSPAHPAVASALPRPPTSSRQPPRPAERAPVTAGADPVGAVRSSAPATAAGGGGSPTPSAPTPSDPSSRPAPASSATAEGAGSEPPEPARPPHETPADVVAALQEDPRPASRAEPRGARTSDRPVRTRPSREPVAADTALGAGELCAQVGISEALLADLERFGLVQSVPRGGSPVYGPAALEVARLASRYAELGVEPRHLRMYLVAAEREAGMVEQLAVPLLKQRNPQAQQNAAALAGELAELGAELHRSLLRREVGSDLLP